MNGYVGKLLFINLDNMSFEVRELPEKWARDYLGGYTLGAKILFDEMPAKADVFGSESLIGYMAGPLNNTSALYSGRYTVVSKSPVTGGFNDCNSGGYFGPMLKKAGFDGVFVRGLSEKPVYILINNGEVSFRDASHLWGMTTTQTEEALKAELPDGSKFNAAIIGPAGERLSYMAAVMNDSHRAAGRGGSGAVMGSKKLKALVVMGNQETPVFSKETIAAVNKAAADFKENGPMKDVVGALGTFGTNMQYNNACMIGDTGVKNWRGSVANDWSEDAVNATGVFAHEEKYKTKRYGCSNCIIRCGAFYEVKDGKWPLKHTPRPEYETSASFGPNLLCSDFGAIMMCNELCNEYGVDTISMGGTVAWAMDCYDRGILTREELDGIDLTWGNPEAIVEITKKIASGEGCGEVLKLGSYWAAKKLGKGLECVVAASGIEPGQHSSLLHPALARSYRYDPTPGRHVKGSYGMFKPMSDKGTGYIDVANTARFEISNSSGMCLFDEYPGDTTLVINLLNAVTGFNFSIQDGINTGIRSMHLRQAFNVREGLRRKDFWLSEVMLKAPQGMGGPMDGVEHNTEQHADNFFEVIGWSPDMVPLKEAMENIGGLENVIAALYPAQPAQ